MSNFKLSSREYTLPKVGSSDFDALNKRLTDPAYVTAIDAQVDLLRRSRSLYDNPELSRLCFDDLGLSARPRLNAIFKLHDEVKASVPAPRPGGYVSPEYWGEQMNQLQNRVDLDALIAAHAPDQARLMAGFQTLSSAKKAREEAEKRKQSVDRRHAIVVAMIVAAIGAAVALFLYLR